MPDPDRHTTFKLVLPISSEEELLNYQKGILYLLGKVEIGSDCEPEVRQHIKSVYKLLLYLSKQDGLIADNTN